MSRERMELSEMANALFTQIMRQREKILEAFVAETGLHPSECVQVLDLRSRLQVAEARITELKAEVTRLNEEIDLRHQIHIDLCDTINPERNARAKDAALGLHTRVKELEAELTEMKTPLTCQNCVMWDGVLTLGTCLWNRSKVYEKQTLNWEKTPCISPRDLIAAELLEGKR